MDQHIGVAISGGGHRAAIWGLGTLLYLVDSGKHREVAAISSVSGGSITNGVVAHETDFPTTDPRTFDTNVTPLVRHIADTGLFFWGPATNAYVISVLAGLTLAVLALLAGIALLCAEGLSPRAGGTLLASAVLLALVARWFARRSDVVDRALARTHFTRAGQPTRLADVHRSVDHILCATELQSSDHLYLSPRFLYSYTIGLGTPADMRLSTAVQASACLPGAFSPRRLKTAGYRFHGGHGPGAQARELLLTDGGVYDNMADQWLDNLDARLQRETPPPAQGTHIDQVIVANASAPQDWQPLRRARLVLLGELATLQRASSVMYQVTTERRRTALVRQWQAAAYPQTGQQGVLVHIGQTPYTVADKYRNSANPERAERADAVIALLGDDCDAREAWDTKAKASIRVPTVLRKLGQRPTLDLLEHSYVLAMCNLHIILGYPLLPPPTRERFVGLLGAALRQEDPR